MASFFFCICSLDVLNFHRLHPQARPGSAPLLHRRSQRNVGPLSREHWRRNPHASAWLAPRITRLERETHDLLTACRKAGRNKGNAAQWLYQDSRHRRVVGEPHSSREDLRRRRSDSTTIMPSKPHALFWSGEQTGDNSTGKKKVLLRVFVFINGLSSVQESLATIRGTIHNCTLRLASCAACVKKFTSRLPSQNGL